MVRARTYAPFIASELLVLSWSCCLKAAEPTVAECLTASETSFTFDSQHALRAERAQLLICGAASCPTDVRKECLRRVEELNLAIPTVVFQVKDSAGADIDAVKVWMDDELLSDRLDGSAIAVDPGEHRFRFASPGRAPFETRLLIRETEKARQQLVTWPANGNPNDGHGERRVRDHKISAQRISALVAGGIGLVGVGIGAGFGVTAMSRRDDAREVCPATQCPTQEGVERWNRADSSANVATAAFVIGAVGLAGAAVLWFTDRSAHDRTQVGLGPGTLQLKSVW